MALANTLFRYPVLSELPTWAHVVLISGAGVAAIVAACTALDIVEAEYEWTGRLMKAAILVGCLLVVAGFLVGVANPVRRPPEPPAITVADVAGPVVVPEVVGMSLDQARSYLGEMGLRSEGRDASAAHRAIEGDVQWVVVGQSPVRHTSEAPGAIVSLSVIRRGESEEAVLRMSADEVARSFRRDVTLNYVGLTVDQGRALAASVGVDLTPRDSRSERRDPDGDWLIVSQDDPPGSVGYGGTGVGTLPKGEAHSVSMPANSRDYVSRFIGLVTGYSTESASDYDVGQVIVDDQDVDLALIATFDTLCPDDVDNSRVTAVRDSILPIGTRVLVVMRSTSVYETDGVMHVLEQQSPSRLDVVSINERLVTSGWWIPGYGASDPRESSKIEFSKSVEMADVSPTFVDYSARIADAGNAAVAAHRGGIEKCSRQWAKRDGKTG